MNGRRDSATERAGRVVAAELGAGAKPADAELRRATRELSLLTVAVPVLVASVVVLRRNEQR